jgi:hypothetical protein
MVRMLTVWIVAGIGCEAVETPNTQDSGTNHEAGMECGGLRETCLGENGQIWLDHVQFSPSLVVEGEDEVVSRFVSFFFRDTVSILPSGAWCFDMIDDARNPMSLSASREYLDVGEISIEGSGELFHLVRRENETDYMGRPPHDLFYQLETTESALKAGVDYTVALTGTTEVPEAHGLGQIRLPEMESSALDDIALSASAGATFQWTSESDAYVPSAVLSNLEGQTVVWCFGDPTTSGDAEVTVTPEAVSMFVHHVPSGSGRLSKMSSIRSLTGSEGVKPVDTWANWITVQLFSTVD